MKLPIIIALLFTSHLCAQHHKIQVVLTNPRSVSTAFEKSMMARGDHKVFHEPWIVSHMYHKGNPDVFSQLPPQELRDADGYAAVKELIYSWAQQKPVFLKDMVWGISEDILNDRELLSDSDVVFTFLLRDPALSIESFFLKGLEKWNLEKSSYITQKVFRYDELVRIAEKYREVRGEWPVIVEAEELCSQPQTTMQAFCSQAGIDYIEDSLNWDEGMPEEWKHLASWHKDAADSKGFFVPKRDEIKARFTRIPDDYIAQMEQIYQQQKPFYDQLRAMKR